MHIARLEHIALSVADMSRSLGFYRDVLGMELVRELDCDGSTSLGTVVGLPGCHANIAHLMCGDSMLDLFEYLDPRGEKIPSLQPSCMPLSIYQNSFFGDGFWLKYQDFPCHEIGKR